MSPEIAFSKPRRRLRWVLPAIGFSVLIAGAVGYKYWISTPQYSLLQAKSAFEAHDLKRFEKFVAFDECADSLSDDVVGEAVRQLKQAPVELNPFGEVGQKMAQGLLMMVKPALSAAVKKAGREFVSTGQIASIPGAGSGSSINVAKIKDNLVKRGVRFEGVENVNVEGDKASVELLFNNNQTRELPVQLEMRRVEGGWQVSKWKNATAWIRKELPTAR